MDNKATNWQNAGIGLVGIALIGWITISLFSTLEQAPWQALGIILTVFGTAFTIGSNLQTQIRNEQREHKVEIYEQITHFFFETIFAVRLGHPPKNEEEIIDFLVKVTPKLVMWSSDEVLQNFREFRQCGIKQSSDPETFGLQAMLIYEKMLLSIRKDLGHKNQNLNNGSILGIFVNDIDEYIATMTQIKNLQQAHILPEAKPKT